VRLRKRDVEELFASYDIDPIGALTAALRRVLDRPDGSWTELLVAAPFSNERRGALECAEQSALDALAAELNELRQLVERA
jgi:hypothetical protein